jgi:CRP-like cAMP-binding protein
MLLHCVRGIGLNLRKRLALELLELAASFGVEHRRGTILTVTPTHEDLANSIGASRQKVTECLADFKRHRVVIRDGRRLIVVPQNLRRIVEKG